METPEQNINPIETVIIEQPIEVKIADIEIPFMSLVTLLTKLVLAAIPAAIIAALIIGLSSVLLLDLYRSSH